MSAKVRKKDIDYILEELVGGSGWWQWRTTLLLFPLLCCGGFPLFISVYAAYAPPHRCLIPECDAGTPNFNETFLEFALPQESKSGNVFKEAEKFDSCNRYAPAAYSTHAGCGKEAFDTEKIIPCDEYVYDTSQMKETLTTRLNLVCEDDNKRRLFSTVLMLGLLVGSLIGGHISDKFGRKKSMFISAVIVIPNVLVGGLVANYYVYIVTRFLTCTALPIIWIAVHTYGLEYFGPKNRKLLICVKDIPIGSYLLALVLYLARTWTQLHLTVGILGFIALPVWFFVPESPRWLAGNNRKEEAEKVFLDIARTNGKDLNMKQRKELSEILEVVEMETEPNLNPFHMFKPSFLVKTMILLLSWITVCVGFYALTLSATKLAGDIVLNYLYTVIADTPTFILLYFVLDGFGRRYTLLLSQLALGLSCVALAFLPKDHSVLILITYLIGKTGAGLGFIMVYLVTAELYPTNLRSQSLGLCSMVSRIFGLAAPFVTKLAIYGQAIPMLVLGLPTVVAAILALFLTETSGKDLPQTMKEGEAMDELSTSNNNFDSEKELQGEEIRKGKVNQGYEK